MRKNIVKLLLMIALLATASCDESLSGISDLCEVEITVTMPDDLPDGTIESAKYEIKNVTIGKTLVSEFPTLSLTKGLYDIRYDAQYRCTDGRTFKLRGLSQSCVVNQKEMTVTLSANSLIDSDDLIIVEVFFTGTLQPSGNGYNGDDYVKLYNNTDQVIYADGITLFESKFNTTDKNSYDPDIMHEAMTVQALYTVPGNGTDHPVAPGEYFLLADNGIDHRVANPNSFDLSGADFEWYDVSSSPSNLDIDSATVPNLDKWYCYTLSYWMLHNRGYKAFGIARIPVNKDQYLSEYKYAYNYELVTLAGSFSMEGEAYRLPNSWIKDVVNCSVASEYAWNVCAASLDCGWTSCGTIGNDKTRFIKAVRRKLLYVDEKGKAVFKDTNNSTVDFNASVTPSEIELQHSVKAQDGTIADQITYDGVTPIKIK